MTLLPVTNYYHFCVTNYFLIASFEKQNLKSYVINICFMMRSFEGTGFMLINRMRAIITSFIAFLQPYHTFKATREENTLPRELAFLLD